MKKLRVMPIAWIIFMTIIAGTACALQQVSDEPLRKPSNSSYLGDVPLPVKTEKASFQVLW